MGISTLFAQKYSAETAESKKLSRTDSDSLLSVVSKDCEDMLQSAFEMAGQYVGIEAPKVSISRDFDTQILDGQQVGQYLQLWTQGAISHETLLSMLQQGEVLPSIDIEQELEMVSQEKASTMMMDAAAPAAVTAPEPGEGQTPSDDTGDIRGVIEERLRKLVAPNDEEED